MQKTSETETGICIVLHIKMFKIHSKKKLQTIANGKWIIIYGNIHYTYFQKIK